MVDLKVEYVCGNIVNLNFEIGLQMGKVVAQYTKLKFIE